MLAGFQIIHSDGLKGSSHSLIITTFSMSTSTESMLLSLLSAPSFMTCCDGRCIKKEHSMTDRSDVIFEVPKCSKIRISGDLPRTPLG